MAGELLASGWRWTWQDPVALGLVALVLALTFYLRRRWRTTGCEGCASGRARPERQVTSASPVRVPLEATTLGRRRPTKRE